LGDDIDANDVVIRFNTAVVENHEADLGSRTDVRITGRNRIFYEDCDEIVLIIDDRRYRMPDEVNRILPMEPIFYVPLPSVCQEWGKVMKNVMKHEYDHTVFSSGHWGVCVALDLCERVSIYGFDAPNSEGKFPEPYHVESHIVRTGHPWIREYLARMQLNKSKDLCLH